MSEHKHKKPAAALDIDFHESTHRSFRSMSTRKLISNPNRHDDLLRSGSTHQLLNRPYSHPSGGPDLALGAFPGPARPPPPPGAPGSLATEETEDDMSDSGSDFSGGSFCDADGDSPADQEYLSKDLGASLHDDDLQFDSGDDKGKDDGAEDLIADVKARMKIEEEAAAK